MAGERLGTIFLLFDTEVLNAELRDIGMMILLVLAVSLLLSYLISAKLQAVVSEPVIHLAQTVRAITNKRDYELRAMPAGRDEIGFLVDAFNRMLDDLQREMTDRLEAETALQLCDEPAKEEVAVEDVKVENPMDDDDDSMMWPSDHSMPPGNTSFDMAPPPSPPIPAPLS